MNRHCRKQSRIYAWQHYYALLSLTIPSELICICTVILYCLPTYRSGLLLTHMAHPSNAMTRVQAHSGCSAEAPLEPADRVSMSRKARKKDRADSWEGGYKTYTLRECCLESIEVRERPDSPYKFRNVLYCLLHAEVAVNRQYIILHAPSATSFQPHP
jgi:hypothetical protein